MMTPHLNFKFRVQTCTVFISSKVTFFTIVAEDSTVLSLKPIAIGGGRESLENIQ